MKKKKIFIMIIVVLILLAIDQISKYCIYHYVDYDTTIGNDILAIQIEYNTKMSFGFGYGNGRNIILSLFVIGIIISFIKKQIDNMDIKTSVAISMILAGGIGNICDRLIRNAVLDFIKVGWFPIFNLADCFIVVGWILMVVFLLFYYKGIEKNLEK